ncbi:hypothetical protein [Nocardia sp. NPDC050406]|uniref:hypothetical protein n=1 Tax=Nocardia sp. NPDC050406 TaxID=3364318 RepID=UPI0037B80AC4
MPVSEVNSVLADTAFGPTPARAAVELPAASDAAESWLRAVALGGVGHYAAARTELTRARRLTRDPILLSLTHSTEGSLLRQLGWHARAAISDGHAAALTLPDLAVSVLSGSPAADAVTTARLVAIAHAEAVCDALTGLAADALGTGRPALAARLLDRCRAYLPVPEESWRPRIRLHWVSAETALFAPGSGLITPPDQGDAGFVPMRARDVAGVGESARDAAGVGESAREATRIGDPGGTADSADATVEPPTAFADPALAHAAAALALAERAPSVRHRVKSRLLLAAASAAAGDLDRARLLAAETADQCREFELLPLRWACAMLRSGIDPASAAAAEAAECARLLAGRGGRLRSAS